MRRTFVHSSSTVATTISPTITNVFVPLHQTCATPYGCLRFLNLAWDKWMLDSLSHFFYLHNVRHDVKLCHLKTVYKQTTRNNQSPVIRDKITILKEFFNTYSILVSHGRSLINSLFNRAIFFTRKRTSSVSTSGWENLAQLKILLREKI